MLGDVLRARRCHHRARVLWRRRRHQEACTVQDRAVRLYTRSGSRVPELAAILAARLGPATAAAAANCLGVLAKDPGHYEQAATHYAEAIDVLADADGAYPQLRATLQHNLAGLAHIRGEYVRAEAPARLAVALRRQVPDVSDCEIAADETVLGAVLAGVEQARRRFDKADNLLHEVVGIKRKVLGDDHPEIAAALNNLAALEAEQGRPAQARDTYGEALRIFDLALGPERPHSVACRENLVTRTARACPRRFSGTW
jgi:tetratricopeptide (TPR) repeat protein